LAKGEARVEILFGLTIVGVALSFPVMIAKWIFDPFDRAALAARRPTHYQIVDFLSLILQLQMVFAVFALVGYNQKPVATLAVLACVAVLAVWVKGVSVLSGAGIEDPWRRVAFIWFVLPMTFVGALGCVPVTIGFVIGVIKRGAHNILLPMLFLVIGLPFSILLCKGLSNWIVLGIPPRPPLPRTDSAGRNEAAEGEIETYPEGASADPGQSSRETP
jgi:hypothetical protein